MGAPEDRCLLCSRPRWDGGHALNEAECNDAEGEACRLHQRINALIVERDRAMTGMGQANTNQLASIRRIESLEGSIDKIRDALKELGIHGNSRDGDLLAAAICGIAAENWRELAQRYHLALRNCLALARVKLARPARQGDWPDIVRFCGDVGVVPRILRLTATSPPPYPDSIVEAVEWFAGWLDDEGEPEYAARVRSGDWLSQTKPKDPP